jgi:hypothetical protein
LTRSITQDCHDVESPHSGVPGCPSACAKSGVDRPATGGFVRDLPEQVGEVVEGIDHVADVGLLDVLDARVERQYLVVEDGPDGDPIDVVGGVEGMALDMEGRQAQVERPSIEEHYRDVDAAVARRDNAVAQPVEEGVVEPGQIELRLAVGRLFRPDASPGLWPHAEVKLASRRQRPESLPAPEADEVVAVILQEVEIRAVVELLRDRRALRAGPHAVVEVVPDVRSREVDGPSVGSLARCDHKIARVVHGHREGFGAGAGASRVWLV